MAPTPLQAPPLPVPDNGTPLTPLLPPLLQLDSLADAVPVDAIETQQVAAYMGGWTVHKEMVAAGMRDIKVRAPVLPRARAPTPSHLRKAVAA